MEGTELDSSATWTGSFLSGLVTAGGGCADVASVGFTLPPAAAGSTEPLGVGPILTPSDYPTCYPLPAETGGGTVQPCPTTTPGQQAAATVLPGADKEQAWYQPGEIWQQLLSKAGRYAWKTIVKRTVNL